MQRCFKVVGLASQLFFLNLLCTLTFNITSLDWLENVKVEFEGSQHVDYTMIYLWNKGIDKELEELDVEAREIIRMLLKNIIYYDVKDMVVLSCEQIIQQLKSEEFVLFLNFLERLILKERSFLNRRRVKSKVSDLLEGKITLEEYNALKEKCEFTREENFRREARKNDLHVPEESKFVGSEDVCNIVTKKKKKAKSFLSCFQTYSIVANLIAGKEKEFLRFRNEQSIDLDRVNLNSYSDILNHIAQASSLDDMLMLANCMVKNHMSLNRQIISMYLFRRRAVKKLQYIRNEIKYKLINAPD